MSRNQKNMEDYFRSAYNSYEEDPSAQSWEKINAELDHHDAYSYRKKFIGWKRTALILLFLLLGFTLYESIITYKSSEGLNKPKLPRHSIPPAKLEEQTVSNIGPNKISERQNIGKVFNTILKPEVEVNYKTSHLTPVGITFRSSPSIQGKINNRPIDYNSIATVQGAINIGKKKYTPNWSYTPFISYEWAAYRIDSDLPIVEDIKEREVHEPSFSAGVLLTRQQTKHWGFQTGLVYYHTSIGIARQKIYAVNRPAGNPAYKYVSSSGNGYIKPGFEPDPAIGDSLNTTEATHTLQYLSVPVMVKYKIGRNKLSITPSAGIATNILFGTKIETEVEGASNYEKVKLTRLEGTRTIHWSFTSNLEVEYKLKEKISLYVRPSYQVALSPIAKSNDVETFPYSFGAGAGITIKF